jgi:flagellar protein FliO/FliZ
MISLRYRAITAALMGAIVAFTVPDLAFAEVRGPHENTPLNLPGNASSHLSSATPTGSGGSLARTFIGLAVVVAVIYGLYWVLRQVKSSREVRSSGRGLSTEASIPLGAGRSLHLVRAGSELVLVGVAEHGVTPIRSYSQDEAQAIGLIGGDGDDGDDDAGSPRRPSRARLPRSLVDAARQWTVRR